jgi:hypothetical protein
VPPELGSDPRAVVRAIKAGASFVTTGPFLEVSIEGSGPGTTVQAKDKRVTLSVRVQAPVWMSVNKLEVFVGKERVLERAIPAPHVRKKRVPASALRLEVSDISLPVPNDTFVIVRVVGDVPIDAFFGRNSIAPRAFSNPIFVDADGDGETPWPAPGTTPRPKLEPVPPATDKLPVREKLRAPTEPDASRPTPNRDAAVPAG